MFNASYHLGLARLRENAELRRTARYEPHYEDPTVPRTPQSVTVRLADDGDAARLEQMPGVQRSGLPLAPLLIGEIEGWPIAALSLTNGVVVAERREAAHDVVALLRLRAAQLRRA
jgi:hypothetical protein